MSNADNVIKFRNEFQMVRAGDCEVIWPEAQRVLKETRAAKYAREFNPDYFGVVTVTEKNGRNRHHVIDGQTRVAALKKLGQLNAMIPAIVKPIHEVSDAADMFTGINSASKPSVLDHYLVRVTAGSPEECEVDELVRSLGYEVENNRGPSSITAPGALMLVYRAYGLPVLRVVLETMRETWPSDALATAGTIIQAYGHLIGKHAADVDARRLVDRVAKRYTPASLLATAKSGAVGGPMPIRIAFLLAQAYTAGARGGKRIDWQV